MKVYAIVEKRREPWEDLNSPKKLSRVVVVYASETSARTYLASSPGGDIDRQLAIEEWEVQQ